MHSVQQKACAGHVFACLDTSLGHVLNLEHITGVVGLAAGLLGSVANIV